MATEVQVNADAYEAVQSMQFDIINVLYVFGSEVWENNQDLLGEFSCSEIEVAFTESMLNDARRMFARSSCNTVGGEKMHD